MAFKMTNPFKQKETDTTATVDPDAPGTPGEPGYESEVKYEDLDEKGKKIWNDLRKKKKDE